MDLMRFNKIFSVLLLSLIFLSVNRVTASYWEHDVISFTNVSHLTEGDKNHVVIVVIDSGIDFTHDEFHQDLLWTNPMEIPDNGIDDDENGYIDDIHG